jgi:hypothetical protein
MSADFFPGLLRRFKLAFEFSNKTLIQGEARTAIVEQTRKLFQIFHRTAGRRYGATLS